MWGQIAQVGARVLPGAIRYLASGLGRAAKYAPSVASAYSVYKSGLPAPVSARVIDPRSGISVSRELANSMPDTKWVVPIQTPHGTQLIPEEDENRNLEVEEMSFSAEALSKVSELAPHVMRAIDVLGTHPDLATLQTYIDGYSMGFGPVDKHQVAETERLRLLAATIQDMAVATDVIMKHDPAPGSLDARFIGEELACVALCDAVTHEALRNLVLGRPGIGKYRLTPYRRARYRDLYNTKGLGTVRLTSFDHPMTHIQNNAMYWGGNGSRLHILEKDPSYRQAIEHLGYKPNLRITTLPPGSKRYNASRNRRYDAADGCCPYQKADQVSADGVFFNTPTFVARMGDLEPGVYGETRIDALPFEIVINNRNVPDRSLVSFVHEALHGYDELHKLGIDHNQLHSLSVYLTQEAIPGYLALNEFLNKSDS